VEVSTDGGATFAQSYLTTITTGNYVTKTINILTVNANTVIKLSNNGVSGRGIRMQDIKLTAAGSSPTISFDSATSTENETDTDVITTGIPITLSNYDTDVTVTATVNGASTAEGSDYIIDLAALTFNANETLNIPLTIKDDADFNDETIIIDFTVTSGTADLGTSQHTVTITDDETPAIPSIIITEVADPGDNADPRFVEIYNNSDSAIDLATEQIHFSRQANGSGIATFTLTGIIQPNSIMTIGNSSNSLTNYGFNTTFDYGSVTGNGDDGYYLYYGGDETTGTLLDAYGVLGVDGTGEAWEYENSRAIRLNPKTVSPNNTWNASEWTITSADVEDMTPGALENEFRYDGAWKPRDIYTNVTVTDDVYISSNVTLTANLAVTNFEIEAGKITTIDAGGSLIVSGTSSGNITYNINVVDDNWHLISSPVVGESYDDTWANNNAIADGSGTNRGIATYQNGTLDTDTDGGGLDTATGPWVYMLAGESGPFSSGTGYSLKRTNSGTYSFTGTLPTTSITTAITKDVTNWNLIGNPYPSYINIETFLSTNSTKLSGAFQSIYVWNASTDSYDDLATGFVHPGQAFFVNAAATPETVSFTEAMQSNQTGITFYKTESTTVINLNLKSGESTKSTQINYLKNKTTGLDPRFDIGLFDGTASNVRIYTHLISENEGISFRRQTLPTSNYEAMVIPVGVMATENSEITFSANALNLQEGLNVYLEDRLNNTFTRLDIENSEYKTTITAAKTENRFYLHTKTASVLNTPAEVLDNVTIYKTNNSNLRITGLQKGTASISIFSVLGKKIMNTSFEASSVRNISLPNLASGVYIVKLKTKEGSLNKKIILE